VTPTFFDAWWKRHRAWRNQRFWQQRIANQSAWGERLEIEDLTDPHGKRLLFGVPKPMAVGSRNDDDAL
jgi:hypothetical protein